MDEVKFKKLMENKEFVKKMFETKTPNELKSIFLKEGLEINDQDLDQILKAIAPLIKTSTPLEIKDPKISTPIPVSPVSDQISEKISGGINMPDFAAGAGSATAISLAIAGGVMLYKKGIRDGQKELLELYYKFKNLNEHHTLKK